MISKYFLFMWITTLYLCTFYTYLSAIPCSTLQIRPFRPYSLVRLSPSPVLFYIVSSICLGPPSSLLFVPAIHISHVHPPLTTRRLNIAIQVNNMGAWHLMYNRHTYIHHIMLLTIQPFFYTSSTLLGKLAGPDHSSGTVPVSSQLGWNFLPPHPVP
jgi:hypothetical protein